MTKKSLAINETYFMVNGIPKLLQNSTTRL